MATTLRATREKFAHWFQRFFGVELAGRARRDGDR
jgi:hypothetical protein